MKLVWHKRSWYVDEICRSEAFLIVQDSQPYSTIRKTKAFTILHFVVIVISLEDKIQGYFYFLPI